MSVVRRAGAVSGQAGRGVALVGTVLVVGLLLAGPAAAGEAPPVPDGVDPCAVTNPDGSPKEPDPMCQSGLPVEEGAGGARSAPVDEAAPVQGGSGQDGQAPPGEELQYEGDVLPVRGENDRALALAAVGAGLVVVGTGAFVVVRRRAARPSA